MARVLVLMTADRGANFRGEKCYFEEDKVQQLLAQKACVLLDEEGNPIIAEAGVVEGGNEGNGNSNTGGNGNGGSSGEGNAEGGKGGVGKSGGKGNGKKKPTNLPNPFEIDGFDPKIVAALADAGINTPEDLRAYVASGKTLAALPVIGIVTEKELLDLYGQE